MDCEFSVFLNTKMSHTTDQLLDARLCFRSHASFTHRCQNKPVLQSLPHFAVQIVLSTSTT